MDAALDAEADRSSRIAPKLSGLGRVSCLDSNRRESKLRKTALLAVMAALAISGVAGAQGTEQHRGVAAPPRQACNAERAANPAAFRTKYANENGKRAFRRCVRQHVRNAARTCRAERRADRAAFKAKYANENGKRAFRRCVGQHSGDAVPVPVS